VRVKVRAVILIDGRLVVSRERRRGVEYVLLPGGRVQDGESITDALAREVREEIGLEIEPKRLVYVTEVVGTHAVHDLNLIWLAEPRDANVVLDDRLLMALDDDGVSSVMPPIVDEIKIDASSGWSDAPRWLGNVRRAGGRAVPPPS
jgi:ADP-ribose pyrophosphatase YjhB (NUDIX family)